MQGVRFRGPAPVISIAYSNTVKGKNNRKYIIFNNRKYIISCKYSQVLAVSTRVTISLPHSLFFFLFYFPYLHRWNPFFHIYLFHQNFLIHMPFLCFLHSLVHSFYLTSIASRLCTSLL